jgi:hypothetical protein
MTTKLKTRKPAAADLKKMATLDFEPWKENPAEALLWFNFEVINNPHLISCRLACTVMGRSKPELIEMIKKDDEFFKGVAELIEAARGRMLVALASCAEAP